MKLLILKFFYTRIIYFVFSHITLCICFRFQLARAAISGSTHTTYLQTRVSTSFLKGLITPKLKIIRCALEICRLRSGKYYSQRISLCLYFTDSRGCFQDSGVEGGLKGVGGPLRESLENRLRRRRETRL